MPGPRRMATESRRHELDIRFGKVLRAGRTRSVVSVDIYNALNSDAPLTAVQTYTVWQRRPKS